jgi:dTDP-glucose pyrophosphorylase/predicted transcriptional regulator
MKKVNNWRDALVSEKATIHDAIKNLDDSKLKIILVIKSDNTFVGTITDGDIRRGLLKGLSLTDGVHLVVKKNSISVLEDTQLELINKKMQLNQISQIPIVDRSSRIVGLYEWSLTKNGTATRENLMIIMAGGVGKRLRPFTDNCPKPMLMVHNKPIIEHIILNAKSEGFKKFIISINYLGTMIEEYFGKGENLDVEIAYIKEKKPLGTSGALGLIHGKLNKDFIVTNGDVISNINYGDVLDFHCKKSSIATMAVRQHELHNPYGVVQLDGENIIGFEEKPVARSNINAGIYALSPKALDFIEKDVFTDMPSLFENLRLQKKPIKAYFTHENWIDIGRPKDLNEANLKKKNN